MSDDDWWTTGHDAPNDEPWRHREPPRSDVWEEPRRDDDPPVRRKPVPNGAPSGPATGIVVWGVGGGSFLLAGSVEAIFPKLFDSPAARVSAFLDFGNVYDGWDNFSASELRASAGVALLWRSPMGPLSISYALPLRKKDGDKLERLQFTFGGVF